MKNTVTVVGHRGFSNIAPENTLVSMRKAIALGVYACETDVYRCKSGEFVIMHDKDVKRTTNGKGEIPDLTFAEIRKLDAGSWKGPEYKGEQVPTLQEYLQTVKKGHCHAVIEIKMEGITRQVLDIIKAEGMFDDTTVIAFSANVIREVRSMEPKIACAWLYNEELKGSEAEQAKEIIEKVRATHATTIDIYHIMLTKEIIADLHKSGITVWAWTVDDPARMKDLYQWGLDSITTNRPDLAIEVKKTLQ